MKIERIQKGRNVPDAPRSDCGAIKTLCNFELEIYPDNVDDMYILHKCTSLWKYAYCLHDKDVYEEDRYDEEDETKLIHSKGQQKKPHYHLLVFLPNTTQIHIIKEFLNIPYNRIQTVKSAKSAIRYLIHLDSYTKYRYQICDIKTNVPDKVRIALSTNLVQFEEEEVIQVLSTMSDCKSFMEVMYQNCMRGRWKTLRRMGSFALRAFDEAQTIRQYKNKDLFKSISENDIFNDSINYNIIGDVTIANTLDDSLNSNDFNVIYNKDLGYENCIISESEDLENV